jgi:hypothetical protein
MSGCTKGVALTSVSARNTYWESFTNSRPWPESAGRNSMRNRPGSPAYSSHVECSSVPSGRVAVFRCVNVSVGYHVAA